MSRMGSLGSQIAGALGAAEGQPEGWAAAGQPGGGAASWLVQEVEGSGLCSWV